MTDTVFEIMASDDPAKIVFLHRLQCAVRSGWRWHVGIDGAMPEPQRVEAQAMEPAEPVAENPFL
jgi:hypothetical protein